VARQSTGLDYSSDLSSDGSLLRLLGPPIRGIELTIAHPEVHHRIRHRCLPYLPLGACEAGEFHRALLHRWEMSSDTDERTATGASLSYSCQLWQKATLFSVADSRERNGISAVHYTPFSCVLLYCCSFSHVNHQLEDVHCTAIPYLVVSAQDSERRRSPSVSCSHVHIGSWSRT
jgi:hypothetical protein